MIYFIDGSNPLFRSSEWVPATVEQCLEYFKDHIFIALDTETQGRDPHSKKIISLQLGDGDNQFVIDCRKVDIKLFKNLIESKTCLIHNAKFDYKFLKTAGIYVEKIYDTMLAECVIFCGYTKYGYGLKDVVKRYTGNNLSKDTRGEFYKLTSQALTDVQIVYASKDVKYLHEVREKQLELINKYNLGPCLDLENEVVKALADIEYNGMILDVSSWMTLYHENLENLRKVEIVLDNILLAEASLSFTVGDIPNLFGDELSRKLSINYSSPVETLKIANKILMHLKQPPIISTEDKVISKLTKKHVFFKELSNYRELAKRVSTYGKNFLNSINPHTGRVHTDFWQVLVTGRVSSGNKDTGAPNLQNIPGQTNGETDNSFRNCFKARPGFKWVSADYSQQELMIMVDVSEEEGLIQALRANEDLHWYVGSIMFNRKLDKVKDKPIRTKVKTMNFGKAYGMGPTAFADRMQISKEEAYELYDLYAKSFPKLNQWLVEEGVRAVRNLRTVTLSPVERIRWYPHLKGIDPYGQDYNKTISEVKRNGPNTVVQGTAANICKEALIGVRNLILEYNNKYNDEVAYLICTVHDAIDVEVREDLAKEFSEEMGKIMISLGNKYVKHVSMKVDITITDEWTK